MHSDTYQNIMEHVVDVDRVAIAPLKARYGQRKFYTEYIPTLKIKIHKEGKNGYISLSDAELLEKYDQARGRGKEAVTEFLQKLGYLSSAAPDEEESGLVRTDIRSSNISGMELLTLAGNLKDMDLVAKWLASDWILRVAVIQQIVIIRPVLLILLDREKLPRFRSFQARGFEFNRVNERSNEEWFVSLIQ